MALVRSSINPGKIKVKAEPLNDGINNPDETEIVFETHNAPQVLLYDELYLKAEGDINPSINNENGELEKMRRELNKAKKELQQYKINEVGKQQQFIQ